MVLRNKKAFAAPLVLFMLAIVSFILAFALAPSVQTVTSEATTTATLNCSNTSISQQDKAVCTQIDSFNFFWIGILLGIAAIIMGGIALR